MKKSRKKRTEGSAAPSATAAEPDRAGRVGPYIVGIGASAGGLEAFEQFFSHLPPTPGWRSSWCRTLSRRTRG